jgi:hypothetical protein
MIKLVIKGWSDEQAWLGGHSWSHLDYCLRLYHCSCLNGVALSRAADALVKRERCELDLNSRERAEALLYTLDTCGALYEFKFQPPGKVIFLEKHRKATMVKIVTKVIADTR